MKKQLLLSVTTDQVTVDGLACTANEERACPRFPPPPGSSNYIKTSTQLDKKTGGEEKATNPFL
jgi:hypothetical protein